MTEERIASPKESLKDADVVICVSGSRGFNDYRFFCEIMHQYIGSFPSNLKKSFITGKASSGADDLIIRFCKQFNHDWVEFPADWNKYQKSAGFIRNVEMGKVMTHLIAFWNTVSPGTKHMVGVGYKQKVKVFLVLIDVEPPEPINERNAYIEGLIEEYTDYYGRKISCEQS